jgi:hypothetical protein
MTIKTTGTSPNPSPSVDEAKLGRLAEQPPANADLSPDRTASKLGRLEGQTPADVNLSPDPALAKRPGGQGKGAQRR